ncbi:MAG: hypothetical protein ACYDHN_11045, partial [Solirubrobacteraceae bacterium]
MALFIEWIAVRRRLVGILLAGVLLAGLFSSSPSSAAVPAPHWTIVATPAPTYFTSGETPAYYQILIRNDGTETSESGGTLSVALPSGLTATGIVANLGGSLLKCNRATLSCLLPRGVEGNGKLDIVEATVQVAVTGPPGTVTTVVTATGGGAPSTSLSVPTVVTESLSPIP